MKTRRILSVVLALMFVLSTLSFASVSVSAATPEVYVDQANGNDSAKGTEDAPLQTLGAAFNKVDDGGTVYIVGNYDNGSSHLPSTKKFITISGVTGSEQIICPQSFGMHMQSDLRLEKITVATGQWAHLNTKGHLLVLGEGASIGSSSNLHVGVHDNATAGEHLIIDGANFERPMQIGAYVRKAGEPVVTGDVTVEVLSGSLASLNVAQDGYGETGAEGVIVTGNLNVRVGADGTIKKMANTGRYVVVKGYMQLIVEEGGSMCELDLTNFAHQDVYKIVLADTANGNVNFTSEAGVFEITCKDGYVAKLESASGATFTGAGKYYAPLGEEVKISFTNEKTLGPAEVDVILEPATPGETEWPVAVSDDAHFSAELLSITPDHAEVGYA
ncbi:MAG: hypothetical protein IKV98_00835, partial [Clostridia bacterium]|nr:hypothetical protein [Clostridia bacterium]